MSKKPNRAQRPSQTRQGPAALAASITLIERARTPGHRSLFFFFSFFLPFPLFISIK
jgi:hypothetical protein